MQNMRPKSETLSTAISATMDNGKKLLEDSKLLFDWNRFSQAVRLPVEFRRSRRVHGGSS